MEKLFIQGGRRLNGTLAISGMKNAALPILYACALNRETCTLSNVPAVSDVQTTLDILTAMGCDVCRPAPGVVEINCAGFRAGTAPDKFVETIRASSYLMGVELGREGFTSISFPGGCKFGMVRPLNYHTRAFEIMGAEFSMKRPLPKDTPADALPPTGFYGVAPDGMHSGKIIFDETSVGATVNIILAAVLTPGTTTITNAAREPHVVDLANFLNKCGAKILGAGSTEIHIEGVSSLHGCAYTIAPDMIEAGTYMCAVAGTGGEVTFTNLIPKHLEAIISKLTEMGVTVIEQASAVTVISDGHLKGTQIVTTPYPGFPTDMQPQFGVLLAVAQGMGSIEEKIFKNRFCYLDELMRMGVAVGRTDTVATFPGGQKLIGSSVTATDLRGGAAMVIAGLIAEGVTEIASPHYIDRGYDDLIGKLRRLGAVIERREVFTECTQTAISG